MTAPLVHRVLDQEPCAHLDDYVARGGGRGLAAARAAGSTAVIQAVYDSGLRGRGGAGFRTGVKWSTVARAASPAAPTPVVVNGAEGEPGTFKDRALLRRNPFKVLEGALVAASAIGAGEVVIALKGSFERERRIVNDAIGEVVAAGWAGEVVLRVAIGPGAYLFGEETALLEVIEGRQPFPRVTPPYRRGLDPNDQPARRSASAVQLAGPYGTDEPPALVDNVETLANIPAIVSEGPDWFRALGTNASPGTIVCTISGRTRRHGVGEVPMGTPLGAIIDAIGGGPRPGRALVAAMSGVANALVPARAFDTPATYEDMALIGSGLGAAGFIVFDDESDLAAVAHAAARFLAVESCGQCEPCKRDGMWIAAHLDAIRASNATRRDLDGVRQRLETVTRGARCFLAQQQRQVVASILTLFPDVLDDHIFARRGPAAPALIAPIVDIVAGQAVLDTSHLAKQPDWTYGADSSGAAPADLYTDRPVVVRPPRIHEARPSPRSSGRAPTELGDPFREITARHEQIRRAVDRLRRCRPGSPDRRVALDELRHHLRVHDDISAGVLYPMLVRAAGDAGTDVAIASHDEIAGAIAAIESLRGHPDGDVLADVEQLIDDHIEIDERVVVPMLRELLDERHLEALGDALATANAWQPE